MLKKLALRSGSSVSTAATSKSARPRRMREPTGAFNEEIRRSSSHTVPRAGPRSTGTSGAIRSLPRSG